LSIAVNAELEAAQRYASGAGRIGVDGTHVVMAYQ